MFSDQYVFYVEGWKCELMGKERKQDKFKGGAIFYDASSTLIHCCRQVSLRAGDTLKGNIHIRK